MASGDQRPPRGKVKPRTRLAAPDTPVRQDAPKPPRLRRTRSILPAVVGVSLAIGLGVYLGVRSAEPDDAVVSVPTAETAAPETATVPATTTPQTPRDLFAESCGSCHTLADAGATAGIGPNLDESKPPRERVLAMIRNGSLSGAMPANLLSGTDAERVATYVAAVAGT